MDSTLPRRHQHLGDSVLTALTNGTFNGSVNSARQVATTNSLHVRAGDNPEVHIDSFGATTDLVGFGGHLGEWGGHKLSHLDGGWQRDPFAIARRLESVSAHIPSQRVKQIMGVAQEDVEGA